MFSAKWRLFCLGFNELMLRDTVPGLKRYLEFVHKNLTILYTDIGSRLYTDIGNVLGKLLELLVKVM